MILAEESMRRVITIMILISIVLSLSACQDSVSFDEIMNTSLNVTGHELRTYEGKIQDSEGFKAIYLPNYGKYYSENKHSSRVFMIQNFILLSEMKNSYYAKKKFDVLLKQFDTVDENGIEERNSSSKWVFDKNKDYIIVLDDNYWHSDVWSFYAYYRIGKNILCFDIGIRIDSGQEEYEEYLKICEELNLPTNDEVKEYVYNFEEYAFPKTDGVAVIP